MANSLYDKGRNRFARGELVWKASVGHTFRCFLVRSSGYTPNLATDEFLSDVPGGSRLGNSGGSARADAPQLTLLDPSAGICDANDITFTAVPAGAACQYIVIFRDDGSADSSSPLVAFIDTATGIPVTPNGADINVAWDNGGNKIFKL